MSPVSLAQKLCKNTGSKNTVTPMNNRFLGNDFDFYDL